MPATAQLHERAALSVIVCLLVLFTAAPLRAERLPTRTYSTADGLPSSFVERIVRDSRGFLWFCTRDGLSRFDGSRFVSYDMIHGLPHPTVNDLIETHEGEYWIATNGGGVCRFHPDPVRNNGSARSQSGLFIVYSISDEPLANRVNVLFQDASGRIWAGTDAGLFRLEGEEPRRAFRRIEFPDHEGSGRPVAIAALADDRDESLWIGTWSGLARLLPDGRTVHYTLGASRSDERVSTIHRDAHGRLWVGFNLGLIILMPEPAANISGTKTSLSRRLAYSVGSRTSPTVLLPDAPGQAILCTRDYGLNHNRVISLLESSDESLWIGTARGLARFSEGSFRGYDRSQGMSEEAVTTLAEDTEGNLWIGGRTGDVTRFSPGGLISYTGADGLADTQIHSIYEDLDGRLAVVAGSWFLHYLEQTRFRAVRPALPDGMLYEWDSQVGFLDRTGEWWLLTNSGLWRMPAPAGTGPTVYTRRDGLPNDHAARMYEDSRGDLWIGLWRETRETLARFDRRTGRFRIYSDADGLPASNPPTAFCEDATGRLWVGLGLGGVARLEEDRFRLFGTADGLPEGGIRALHLDGAGRIWAGSIQSGLCRIEDPGSEKPQFVTYTTTDGLSSNGVRCITEDRLGRIYAGTTRGVTRLDPTTGAIRQFSTDHGLAHDWVDAAFCDSRGTLWFGTRQGLSRLVPGKEDSAVSQSPVLIRELRIAGSPYPISELGEREVSGLEMQDGDSLQIDFSGLSFGMGASLRYEYRLEGAATAWSRPTGQTSVLYAGIRPGSYRFQVRAAVPDAERTTATVGFTVLPPFWLQGWFLSLAVALFVAAAYGAHRYRVRRLVELERVRTRIATDLHDDIGSSLSQISVLSEVARRGVGEVPRVAEPLAQIGEISRGLLDSMSDIVWAVNPRRDSLADLTGRMRRFAGDLFDARGIGFRFEVDARRSEMHLEAGLRREVFLVFKEGVNNIVRHSGCSSAEVDLRVREGKLQLSIRDDGRGFDPAAAREGNGLLNMRDRAARVGGRFEVSSAPGQGTRIELSIPLL